MFLVCKRKGHGLTPPTRRQKIQELEERDHETGATVNELEKIVRQAIILRDITVGWEGPYI
jgi:hypothetical protein